VVCGRTPAQAKRIKLHSLCQASRGQPKGQRRIHGPRLPASAPRPAQLRWWSFMVGRGKHRPAAQRARTLAAVACTALGPL